LSIIDIAGGHEPVANENSEIHLSYNGEIYNYKDLQSHLRDHGHTLRTRTDGEVALHLYEDDPDRFVHHLDGMFALAIFDGPRRRLTIARDPNGIKPLYYWTDGRSLLFASEIKAILPLLDRRPAISHHALREFLRWKYIPDPLSIYDRLYKLPPGGLLTATNASDRLDIRLTNYWRPDFGGDKITREADAIDQLDTLLQLTIERHLIADVEIGALLSGGVDSSLVVALACKMGSRPIKTFSVGFEEAGFDQLPFARVVAEKYGTDHFEEHVRLDPVQTIGRLVRQFDEPFADSSALACFRVCEVAARHVKVALTGDGGDESFAGYRRYEEIVESTQREGPATRALHRFILATSGRLFSPEAKFLKRSHLKVRDALARHAHHQRLCSDWLLNRLLPDAAQAPVTDPPWLAHDTTGCARTGDIFATHRAHALEQGWNPVDVAQYVDLRMYLPGDILTKVDRTSMACSLECRPPLLDRAVTAFSARLSNELKMRGGVRKYLLKKVAERYVPPELLYRPKMGFRIPVRRWFKRDLLAQTESLLLDGSLVGNGLLDRRGLAWLMRAQRHPWFDFGSQLWALLFLEQWARATL